MKRIRTILLKLVLMLPLLLLGGCMQTIVGIAAELGVAAAQERTVGGAVDDFTIWTQIKHHYVQEDVNELLVGVSVEVIEGVVHLTGAVVDPASRINAVKLAWQPKGVKEVVNEIQVVENREPASVAKDKWISTQVVSRLLVAEDVKSINYSFETVNAIVYLMGIAQDEQELNKVTNIISKVKGVERVISHVRLRTDPSREL